MDTAGVSTPESDHPSRRAWFDRRTFWPAAVIVLLVVAVVAIPTWLNHAASESTSTVSQGQTVTLEVDDDNKIVVEPIQGWDMLDTTPDQLALRNDKASVTMSVAETPDDLERYYQRLARKLRSARAQVLPGESTTTDTGFNGLTGTLVSDGKTGELSVLAKGDAMVTVQSLIPPDQVEKLKPQITAMVNSAREQ
jgi:hypothetical protein